MGAKPEDESSRLILLTPGYNVPTATSIMKSETRISPDAMLIFLKQAALEDHWTVAYLGKTLGLDLSTAKQVAAEMALAGYIEAVRGKNDTWRNTDVGNQLAGIRSRRLTRAKAEDLLTDLEDRAAQLAMKDSRILKVVAVGSVLTEHDPIQDIDIGVQLESTQKGQAARHADELELMKTLKGRSPALKLHLWNDSLERLPSRVVWKA